MAFSVLRCVMIGSTSNHFCNNQGMALEISFYLVKLQKDRERSCVKVRQSPSWPAAASLSCLHCKRHISKFLPEKGAKSPKLAFTYRRLASIKRTKYMVEENLGVCILKHLYPKTAFFFESVCGHWVGLITSCILTQWSALQSCDKHGKRLLLPWNVLFPCLYHSRTAGSCFLKKRSLKWGLTYL